MTGNARGFSRDADEGLINISLRISHPSQTAARAGDHLCIGSSNLRVRIFRDLELGRRSSDLIRDQRRGAIGMSLLLNLISVNSKANR